MNIQNESQKYAIVLTTINKPTKCIYRILEWCEKHSIIEKWELIIVADKKTPVDLYKDLQCIILTCEMQEELYPALSQALPWNHYSRKNIGYLYAIHNGYTYIAETDDDNYFTEEWSLPSIKDIPIVTGNSWINIFREYTSKCIWPRGLPFEHKHSIPKHTQQSTTDSDIAVYQGLVNNEPDYDAVYRLSREVDTPFTFDSGKSIVAIKENVLSPFNSQNTIWLSCYEYLYLPCTVTFRYTDILRSYIANFGFWKNGKHLAYTPATAIQERNDHNLIKDLEDELPMYATWDIVSQIGRSLGDECELLTFYTKLHEFGIVSQKELSIVNLWLAELHKQT